jgi:hypothetical protein
MAFAAQRFEKNLKVMKQSLSEAKSHYSRDTAIVKDMDATISSIDKLLHTLQHRKAGAVESLNSRLKSKRSR